MTPQSESILREALDLSPLERAELVEGILASFDFPKRQEIDAAWATEAEQRLNAYRRGEIKTVPAEEVFKEMDLGEQA